jgi:CelD/BcsL family acetyltransferase involved in cellulose biosynthesis
MAMTGEALGLPLARDDIASGVPRRMVAVQTEWKSLAALKPFADEWRDLNARAIEPNVFYDPAFALAAAPVFGTRTGAVLVWSKSSPRHLVGFFPARADRRWGVTGTLTGWTHPYAPLGVPLVDRDEAEAAIGAFFEHVGTNEKLPRLVLLPLVTQDGPFAQALRTVLARHGGEAIAFDVHTRALLAPIGQRVTYLDHALSAKKLKELRRQRRRLSEQGTLKLIRATDSADIAPALADYAALEASGWKGRAGTAAGQDAAILAFMQEAVATLAAQGDARVDRLIQNDKTLAATITLRNGDTSWFWKIAYDETVARASPGVQLTLDVTEQLLAEPAIARVDSCATAGHPMIDHLWRERLPLADLLIAPDRSTLRALHVARRLEGLRRGLMAAAKRGRAVARRVVHPW